MSELDARFGALEDGDNTMMVDMDKRLTELEKTTLKLENLLGQDIIVIIQDQDTKLDIGLVRNGRRKIMENNKCNCDCECCKNCDKCKK